MLPRSRNLLSFIVASGLAVAAHAAPGDLDCGFGSNGVVSLNLAGSEAAYDAVLGADGGLVLLGPGTRLVRLTASGALDTSFGSGGVAQPTIPGSSGAFHLAQDSQGRLLIGGQRSGDDGEVFVARLTPTGQLDTSFAAGLGYISFDWSASTASAGSDSIGDLLVGSGDRPLAVGWYDPNGNVGSPSNANLAVARLTTSGVLDTTFAVGAGIASASSPGSIDEDVRAAAIDGLGRIVAIGSHGSLFGPRQTIVARWTADGALDGSFAGSGVTILDLSTTGGDDFGVDMMVDASNRPVLLSQGSDDPIIARLTTAGALDGSFDGDGILQRSFLGGQDVPARVLVQADGRILVTGWPVVPAVGGNFRFASMRFLGGGALDTTWGGTGVVTTSVAFNMRAYAALLTPNGRLVMAGGLNNDVDLIAVRYLTDATVLPTSTTTIVSQAPNPSLRNQPVTVGVGVSAASGAPSGSVRISDGVDSCSATLAASGANAASGSCVLTISSAGTRSLTADYAGNGGACRSTASATQLVRIGVTPLAGPGGALSPSTVQGVSPNGTLFFTAIPQPGFRTVTVSGCGVTPQGNGYVTAPITTECTVSAAFNANPVATNGSLQLLEDATPVAGSLQASDAEGEPLAFALVDAPTRGSAVVTNSSSGSFTYSVTADANGADSFTFRASDGGGVSNLGTVSINITPVNDIPLLVIGADIAHPAGTSGAQSLPGFASFDAGPPDEESSQVVSDFLVDPVSDANGVLLPGSLDVLDNGTLVYGLSGRGGSVDVTLRVRDSGGTTNGGSDTSSPRNFRISVAPGADLEVAIDDGRSSIQPGISTVYAVVVGNAGPDAVVGAGLTTSVPASLTELSWACITAQSTAACPVPATGSGPLVTTLDLAVGTAVRFDLLGTVSASIGSVIAVGAAVTLPAGIAALDPGDDSASDSNSVVADGVFGDGFEGAQMSVPAAQRALDDAAGRAPDGGG